MTLNDINAETITTQQLRQILQLGKTMASIKMREIKSVADRLNIKGVCHKQDYLDWFAVVSTKKEDKPVHKEIAKLLIEQRQRG